MSPSTLKIEGKIPNDRGVDNFDFSPIEKTINILNGGSVPFEFRTTVTKEFHEISDIESIAQMIAPLKIIFFSSLRTAAISSAKDCPLTAPKPLKKWQKQPQSIYQMCKFVELIFKKIPQDIVFYPLTFKKKKCILIFGECFPPERGRVEI